MLIEIIYNMSLVILFMLLSLRLKENILKSKADPYYYKIIISFLAALVIIVLMERPFVYKEVAFDLKSVPLLIISYLYGWKYGIIAASLPAFYRSMLGGPEAIIVIVLEILLAVLIGSIFHENKKSIILNINMKRILLSYILLLAIGFSLFIIFLDYSFYFWTKIILFYSFFSILTLVNSVILINDTNSSIHQNIVEYKNLRENFSENKTKLKKTKNKMDLIGKLSHEFKTPLNLIFSSVQMLKLYNKNSCKKSSKNETSNKIDKYTEIISQNSYRMLRLVNNLIDLVKIDVNSYNLDFKNIDIVKLVKDTTDSVKDYIDHKNRKIEVNSKIKKRIIKCDPISIERVLLNLLSNAVKFTNKGDKIIVELAEKEDMIVISVIDFGVGMKKEELKYIFDEFNQVDDTLSKNSEGSGLGLSIVKAIIEKHNGDIQVESEFGKGTKFSIFLPDKKLEDEEIIENIYDENSDLNRTALELSDL